MTLRLADSLWLNVNVGQDWLRDRPSRGRSGASLEWKATPAWTLIGERFRQFGDDFARLGVRWQQSRSFGVDLGRAAALGAGSVRTWTLGANWTFDAPGSTPRPP